MRKIPGLITCQHRILNYNTWWKALVLCCMGLSLYACTMQDNKELNGKAGEMDCLYSMRISADNYATDNICVVLNTDHMDDSKKIAKQIVEKYEYNEYKSMYFCSQPDMLNVTAYLKENDEEPVLQFVYNFVTQEYKIRS